MAETEAPGPCSRQWDALFESPRLLRVYIPTSHRSASALLGCCMHGELMEMMPCGKISWLSNNQAGPLPFADSPMGSRCLFFDMVEGHLFIWEQVYTCVYVCVCRHSWVGKQVSLLAYKCAVSVSFKVGKDNNQRRKAPWRKITNYKFRSHIIFIDILNGS